MNLARKVGGSFLSVLCGWAVCTGGWMVYVFLTGVTSKPLDRALFEAGWFGLIVAAICGIGATGTWILAFLWIYLFVPRTSPLWNPVLCTVCGIAAGYLIALPWSRGEGLLHFGISAAATGGATCLFASLTAKRFHNE